MIETVNRPFWRNISHLRRCILVGIIIYISTTGVTYYFANDLYGLLCKPLAVVFKKFDNIDVQQRRMIFTGIGDAFFLQLKLASTVGFIISLPLMILPISYFALPELSKRDRMVLIFFALVSLLLFIFGIVLAYWFIMPVTWHFMMSFEDMYRTANDFPVLMNLKADEYFDAAIKMLSSFGFIFQLPLIIKGLNFLGLLSLKFLIQSRRYTVVVIFVVSAFLTPPDVISQLYMAVPMIVLYELSILWCRLGRRVDYDSKSSDGEETDKTE